MDNHTFAVRPKATESGNSEKPLLPYDVVCKIAYSANVGYIDSVLSAVGSHLSKEEKKSIKDSRLSPMRHLSLLECSPLALLSLMRNTRTVLSGSRAVDYFVPGSCKPESDWDFYCEDNASSVQAFVRWSKLIGFSWEGSFSPGSMEDNGNDSYSEAGFRIIRGTVALKNGSGVAQLMWRQEMTAAQAIVKFHSTVPQCFISGFCAVSLYHDLTSRSMGVSWEYNDTYETAASTQGEHVEGTADMLQLLVSEQRSERQIKLDRNSSNKRKYESRGFKYVEYKDYVKSRNGSGAFSHTRVGSRYVGDGECCVVGFGFHLDFHLWPRPLKYKELILGLERIRWYDWDGYTDPDQGNLKFIAQVERAAGQSLVIRYKGAYPPSCLFVDEDISDADILTSARTFYDTLNAESAGAFGQMPEWLEKDLLRRGHEHRTAPNDTFRYAATMKLLPC